jgi:protein TonB
LIGVVQQEFLMRFLAGLPIAAVITVGLFLLMRFFISGDFKLADKEESVRFDINPKVQELEVRQREVKAERT